MYINGEIQVNSFGAVNYHYGRLYFYISGDPVNFWDKYFQIHYTVKLNQADCFSPDFKSFVVIEKKETSLP